MSSSVVILCDYEPAHEHEFPDDWEFTGANHLDPRSDPRWVPTTYVYLDDHLVEVWTTQAPLCVDQAIDEFSKHAALGVKYLQRRVGRGDLELVPVEYDRATDEVRDM